MAKQNNSNNARNKYPKRGRNRNRASGKPTSKPCKSDEKMEESAAKPYNDAKWYTNDSRLVFDAGNHPFNLPIGGRIRDVKINSSNFTIPGVMTFKTVPVVGPSTDAYSPINMAARALYDRVNYKNSRNFSYEAPDLMMSLMAFNSLYAFHAWMRRVYGICNLGSQTNRYIPTGLLSALGVNSGILQEMSDFRYYINLFARRANTFAIPAGMPIFERTYWAYSNIFADAPSAKAGLYMYTLEYVYKFTETSSKYGSSLEPVWMDYPISKGCTLSDIVTFGNQLLEALFASQDVNVMSTDILRAYENNLVKLPDTEEQYTPSIIYSDEVLSQINNIYAPAAIVKQSLRVTQDPNNGTLVSSPAFDITADKDKWFAGKEFRRTMLNTHLLEPTPADVFVMTRLHPEVDGEGVILSCGSEVVTGVKITMFTALADSSWDLYNTVVHSVMCCQESKDMLAVLGRADHWSKFHDAPIFNVLVLDAAGEKKGDFILSDLDNYTTIAGTDLRNIHEVATMSLFQVPVHGTVVGK